MMHMTIQTRNFGEIVALSLREGMNGTHRYCTNAFSMWNDTLEPVGIGIYMGAALINHSCEPNCWTYTLPPCPVSA